MEKTYDILNESIPGTPEYEIRLAADWDRMQDILSISPKTTSLHAANTAWEALNA